jgi:phage shock protein A
MGRIARAVRNFFAWTLTTIGQGIPEILLEKAVQDELDDLQKLRAAGARTMAHEKLLADYVTSKQAVIAAWERQRREFVARGQQEAATEVERKKREALFQLEEMEGRLEEARKNSQEMKRSFYAQKRRYQNSVREREALLRERQYSKILRAVNEARHAASANTPALGMSKRRLLFVNAVIIFLAANSLFDIATDRQHWPFSNYPMYSWVQRDYLLSAPQLFGVRKGEPNDEMPLRGDYIRPFDNSRLRWSFDRLMSEDDPEKRQEMLNEALRDCLTRYEKARLAGDHDGPPLQGIRLYRLQWRLHPLAENRDQPDRRELIAEEVLSQGGP